MLEVKATSASVSVCFLACWLEVVKVVAAVVKATQQQPPQQMSEAAVVPS